ncbi:hypothetical protein C0V77_22185 [Emticicia sp. TH156]|nr:hypothetical protein C0V77_22185 [Emticicia sp. TH156]
MSAIFGLQSYKIDSELVVFFYKKYTRILPLYSIFFVFTVAVANKRPGNYIKKPENTPPAG